MAPYGSKAGSVRSGSRSNRNCEQNWRVKVQGWRTCNVVSCSILQKEQSGLSDNLNV